MTHLRALTVFDQIPAGCKVQPVGNEDSDPHLRAGEFAVVDMTDTDPQHGEVYLIRWQSGGTSIVQAFCRPGYNSQIGDFTGWWTRCLRVLSYDEELEKARKLTPAGAVIEIPRGCMIDGPRLVETFREALIGRVVGIYQAKVDVLKLSGGKV
jgi:hypothetical protein